MILLRNIKTFVLNILFSSHLITSENVLPFQPHNNLLSVYELEAISENLEQSLSNLYDQYAYMDLLPKRDGRVMAEDVNSASIMNSLAYKISQMLRDKKTSVEKLVESLEKASEDYIWRDELENNFTNVVLMNASTEEVYKDRPGHMDDLYGVRVNKSMAGIHVDIEVYQGYPEIVNGLHWSSAVDETFKENKQNDPGLAWQYFAAHTGFMRFYPSVTKWYIPPPYGNVDLFDARRRPWYIQGTSSPKDVIILMDRSGSVHGQTFTIMKFAVETLIDTLGENDFVNVAAFNDSTFWVSEILYADEERHEPWECARYNASLIQATNANKKALVADIQHITATGIANYTDALQFAYATFKKRSVEGETGADCHKLIMLFSDGGTQWPEQVIKKYSNDSDTAEVRIFTYAIGPHPIPTAVLKDLAYQAGGEFTVITTSSGVRTKIQESYLRFIAEPLAKNDKHTFQFTSSYTSAITENLTLSIALPVFNRSTQLAESGLSEVVGVAGIDIPVQQLENLVPREALGPFGYAFVVSPNGMLVMHPYVFPQESYLQDPPHVDFLDAELNPSKLANSRAQLIRGESGGISFSGLVLVDRNHIFANARLKYMYMPVSDSPYSVGVFMLPSSQHLNVTSPLVPRTIDPRTSILAPWNFCGSQPALPKPDLTNKRIIEGYNCDKELLNSLMWAQEWTKSLIEKWEQEAPTAFDIINRAVFTRFGLARTVTGRVALNETSISDLTPVGTEWRDPSRNPAFKRGLLERGLGLFPHNQGAVLSRLAFMNDVPAAAVGVNVTSRLLDVKLSEAISAVTQSNSSFVMLVDEAAVILASSQYQNSCGEFLGNRWPLLLEKLVEAGVFGRRNVTDYQALCEAVEETQRSLSAAHPVYGGFQPLNFLTSVFVHVVTFLQYLQCGFLGCFFTVSAPQGAHAICKAGDRDACILQHTTYFLTNKRRFSGNISCLGDSAQVLVKRLNTSNAIVVAVEDSLVDLSCDGWMEKGEFAQSPFYFRTERTRRVYPKELACRVPRTRKKPDECEISMPLRRSGTPKASAGLLVVLGGLAVAAVLKS